MATQIILYLNKQGHLWCFHVICYQQVENVGCMQPLVVSSNGYFSSEQARLFYLNNCAGPEVATISQITLKDGLKSETAAVVDLNT